MRVRLKESAQEPTPLSNDTSLACCEVAEANECDRVENRNSLIANCVIVVIFNDCVVIFNSCRIVFLSPRLVGRQAVM